MQLIVDRIEVLFWISYIYLVKLWLVRNMNISVVFRLSVMVYDVNGEKVWIAHLFDGDYYTTN